MFFNGKSVREITEDDLLALIGTSREGKTIDFKTTAYNPIPASELENKGQSERDKLKNKWKLDLRNDLTSFANTGGGWIICGMKEEAGVATELLGLGSDFNADATINRLKECSRTGIEPPIDGVVCHEVDLKDEQKSKALVIQIPRSYRFPHRMTETSKFYMRSDRGNSEMNIDELREAFNLSANLTDRIREFRKERIQVIGVLDHEDVPVSLPDGIKVVLHTIPLSFTNPSSFLNFSSFAFLNQAFTPSSNWQYVRNAKFNLDGVVTSWNYYAENKVDDVYIQVFRSGVIETTFIPFIKDNTLLLSNIERFSLEYLYYSVEILKALNVLPPIVVMLSVVNIKGFKLHPGTTGFLTRQYSEILRQDKALLPDVVINNYTESVEDVIKPIFDVMWNMGGWAGSMNYDKEGKRVKDG